MHSTAMFSVLLLMMVGCVICYPAMDPEQDYLEYLASMAANQGRDLFTGGRNGRPDAFDVLYGSDGEFSPQYKALAIQALEQQMLDKGRGGPGAELAEEESSVFNGGLAEERTWQVTGAKVGQVGGVAVCPEGYPHIFHRADREWTSNSFDQHNVFTGGEPIEHNTIMTVHPENGSVLEEWGAKSFYMPHGLAIDGEGNLWMTDVALHQVLKFSPKKELLMTVGEALQPGSDADHFCKPTHVAVASNGDFFVADGYCNSRVVKFSKEGKHLGEFGTQDHLLVPHSVALLEKYDAICVADRENERIICYSAGLKNRDELGTRLRVYNDVTMGRVYSIAYSPHDNLLYGVGIGDEGSEEGSPHGFTIDVSEEQGYYTDIISSWAPNQGFSLPHTMAVSPDGESVYVGDLYNDEQHKIVWKFVKAEQPKEGVREPQVPEEVEANKVNAEEKEDQNENEEEDEFDAEKDA